MQMEHYQQEIRKLLFGRNIRDEIADISDLMDDEEIKKQETTQLISADTLLSTYSPALSEEIATTAAAPEDIQRPSKIQWTTPKVAPLKLKKGGIVETCD